MNFLLDTNLVSEPMKVRPNTGVMAWLAAADENSLFLSAVTVTELRYGIERLVVGNRRQRLDDWLRNDLHTRFAARILPVDVEVADACGILAARSETLGRPLEPRDAFIAATAEVHHLTLVTRNASDFEPVLQSIVVPWT